MATGWSPGAEGLRTTASVALKWAGGRIGARILGLRISPKFLVGKCIRGKAIRGKAVVIRVDNDVPVPSPFQTR